MLSKSPTSSTLSTIANVITAFCLVVLTLFLIVGGTWTVQTVTKIQSTYHPDKMSSMINDISDTVHALHSTTHMLKSSQGGLSLLTDVHNLVTNVEDLAMALGNLPLVVQEASNWRNMSVSALGHLKDMVAAL